LTRSLLKKNQQQEYGGRKREKFKFIVWQSRKQKPSQLQKKKQESISGQRYSLVEKMNRPKMDAWAGKEKEPYRGESNEQRGGAGPCGNDDQKKKSEREALTRELGKKKGRGNWRPLLRAKKESKKNTRDVSAHGKRAWGVGTTASTQKRIYVE